MMATRGMVPKGNYAFDFVTGGSSARPRDNPLTDEDPGGVDICYEYQRGQCFRENCRFVHR